MLDRLRILDMARTAVNVAGDLTTSRLMETWTQRDEAEAAAAA